MQSFWVSRHRKHIYIPFQSVPACIFSIGVVSFINDVFFFTYTGHTCRAMQLPSAESSLLLHLPASSCIYVLELSLEHPANCQHLLCFLQTRYRKRSKRCDQLLKVLIRLFAAVIPLAVAFGVSNLVTVLQYQWRRMMF